MFGIDLGLAFFAGLIWWEIGLFLVLLIGSGIALKEESSAGFFVAFAVIFFMPWSGVGSIWASVSLVGIMYYLILFILAGIGWSFFKWKLFVQKQIEYHKDRRYGDSAYTKKQIKEAIQSKKSYDTIIYWILLWPFSVLGYLVNDFVYNLVKSIVDKIYTIYDRITDKLLDNSDLK